MPLAHVMALRVAATRIVAFGKSVWEIGTIYTNGILCHCQHVGLA